MEEDSTEPQKISKYNSAVAQLMRLDKLWNACNTHSIQGNYTRWNNLLDQVWIELSGDLKPNDGRIGEYAIMISETNSLGKIKNGDLHGFSASSSSELHAKQYAILVKKATWLKRLQNNLGKGTKWDEGEDDYMD